MLDRSSSHAADGTAGDTVAWPNTEVATLAKKIAARRAVIGVVGQGYVGFPLAQRIARSGFTTFGFDINGDTVARCERENRSRRYHAVLSALNLKDCDVLIVAVPTPTRMSDGVYEPDLSLVIEAVRTLVKHVMDESKPRLLLLESTYAPGTTRNVVAPLVAQRFRLGEQVLLGYSPERIDPGNKRFTLENTPKVTSGYDRGAARLTNLFYSQFLDRAVPASSMEAAEATKILENTFRFVNITFAQEFDLYCEQMGIEAREVTGLAATKPFGFMPFHAGPGIGGHCIAEDPYFLYQSMLDLGMQGPILRAALANHEARAAVIVDRVARELDGKPLAGARILLLGVSYKPDIGDPRRSPAMPILQQLDAAGAVVDYHDPHVPRFGGRTSVDLTDKTADDYDLAVVITQHTSVDSAALIEAGWRLYDTHGSQRPHARERALRPAVTLIGEALRPSRTQTLAEIG